MRKPLRITLQVIGGAALLGIGAAIGSSGGSKTAAAPAPTVTVTGQAAAAPAVTVTETVTASPPPPSAGAAIGKFKGSGNQVTPAFPVPDSGNYIVTWSYSGNTDPQLGGPNNFTISNTGGGDGIDLPNDIAVSGHGSTEVSGASGTDRLNVQATGSWTITVTAA